MFLKAKADALISRDDGASPAWIAASHGHVEVLKHLAKNLNKQKLK